MSVQGKTISRRSFMAAAAAVPLVAIRTRPANAAEFEYKLATGQSLTQPINLRLDQAVKRINDASGGRLEIKFFPASQLGSDTDLLTQIRSGGIDFLNIAGSVISTSPCHSKSSIAIEPSPRPMPRQKSTRRKKWRRRDHRACRPVGRARHPHRRVPHHSDRR